MNAEKNAKNWNDGILECWNIGKTTALPTIPLFHYSISSLFLRNLRNLRIKSFKKRKNYEKEGEDRAEDQRD